ncbi:TetR/AcrR family transcriptional regulator [Cupriavidus necator]|uniref:TetR/AcrR family transcriptional regulator n=1 Tax=Cupriavidus necator TaxID=106590 RepID=UPI0005B5568F|nr:TetR/AcrR family transcriptional regulator [Cupriavidus necator]
MSSTTKRRGAPKRGEPSARERLVQTATDLFYQEGVRAIGIDTVIERSGVSKSSLYRTFSSKEELIAAFVEEQDRRFWQWWDDLVASGVGEPRKQLEGIVIGVAELISQPQFRGCPFINICIEFPDRQQPCTEIACANKEEVRERLRVLSRDLGAQDPDRLGDQLAILLDGAYGHAMTVGAGSVRRELIAMARLLIDAQVKPPRRRSATAS